MPKADFILDDYNKKYVDFEGEASYLRLHDDVDTRIAPFFASLHGRLNSLFDFISYKKSINNHLNAVESRELIDLIEEMRQAGDELGQIGYAFELDVNYRQVVRDAGQWLVASGGSPMPESMSKIDVVKYDPVFRLTEQHVELKSKQRVYKTSMIGSGSYATVHRYRDEEYGINFAIKRANRSLDDKELGRFRKEFQILKTLDFPYVLDVYVYDEDRDEYTMEYCKGTLRKYLEVMNNNLTPAMRKRIALQFLYGLNYLHRKNILHRDISFNNVLVKQFDLGAVVVKLSDFGLAKDEDSDLTSMNSDIKGTFIDPVLTSFRDYSATNDIYGAGRLLSFIFSGRRELGACKGVENEIVLRCVDHDPTKRFPNVREIIEEVERLNVSGLTAASDSPA